MFNPQVNEVLARQRQQELLDTVVRVRRAREVRQARQARPHRLRTRTGWWLVQAGIRLVLSGSPPVPQMQPLQPTRPMPSAQRMRPVSASASVPVPSVLPH